MRFKYKEQSFQTEAAKAVCDVFEGQLEAGEDGESGNVAYRMDEGKTRDVVQLFDVTGYRNAPISYNLTDDRILEKIDEIQRHNGIEPSGRLEGRYNLTVEMETGTGKTFTYTETMFELNRRYGWSKFIVVVPSIAIREGVYKSFASTEDYFADKYGKKLRYFIYNSSQLSKIEEFASGRDIHVMIINAQAFNARGKDARRIYMKLDEFQSRRPIDVIAATHPIIIIDEPQSVEGKQTKKHLEDFHPLFTLRYSATPRERYNLVYRLDAMDAYNRKIVKRIAVKGISATGSTATESYVYLESINLSKKDPTATISFDVKTKTGIKKKSRIVQPGDNLYDLSNELEEYKNNFRVSQIDGRDDSLSFVNGKVLHPGDMIGTISDRELRRLQIRETILTHLERERQLYRRGIKVLSLFFIDEVANYRQYDTDGNPVNGPYADMFEEEYRDIVENFQRSLGDEAYMKYLDGIPVEKTHAGYFSIDKKGKMVNSKVARSNKERTSDDVDAFDLIMKDKERLLSFEEPVRFIFSHSALREGWDNPNVFQICTLKNSSSETRKRQEVGRGMRLCVNQNGERMDVDKLGTAVQEVNKLTIIASESYESFARGLQNEIAETISDRPVAISPDFFKGKTLVKADGRELVLDDYQSRAIYNGMVRENYVDDYGALTDHYYNDKNAGNVKVPQVIAGEVGGLVKILDGVYSPEAMKPEDSRKNDVTAQVEQDKLEKKEFQELWKRIRGKSVYTVSFDTEELVKKAADALDLRLDVPPVKYVVTEGEMEHIDSRDSLQSGTAFQESENGFGGEIKLAASRHIKYDLVGKMVAGTGLTRRTIIAILKTITQKTFRKFRDNPELFILRASAIINDEKAAAVIEHITYDALGDTYDTDIFFDGERQARLGENAIPAQKSLYSHVVYDSPNERNFVEKLDKSQEVAVYVKLPGGFFISTPVGHYNPDWAIAFYEGHVKHIYFVAETKGSMSSLQLREVEKAKIECARKHFRAISNDKVCYDVVDSYRSLMEKVMK